MATSYSSLKTNIMQRINELYCFATAKRNYDKRVHIMLSQTQGMEALIKKHTGVTLENKKLLEVGAGQRGLHMRYFSIKNNVMIGIDRDIVPNHPLDYLTMLKSNGFIRVLKTFGRKLLGIDNRLNQALKKQLAVKQFPKTTLLEMDVTDMAFADQSFDGVYSLSVFEHIVDPKKALEEIKRILKPGGILYISVHLWTSHSGCHDPRILTGKDQHLPLWAHLRDSCKHLVYPNAYVNKIRMSAWEKIFRDLFPEVVLIQRHRQDKIGTHDRFLNGLQTIKAQGELKAYTEDELLTISYVAIWKKPLSTHATSV